MNKAEIYALLDGLGIPYETVEHKAVFTVEEADALHLPHIEAGAKNLFLRDDKKRSFFLLTVRDQLSVSLKAFAREIGARPLSFASPEALMARLGLMPGAVTPFGALNDAACTVKLYIDAYYENHLISVHPNDNTATVYLQGSALAGILRAHGSEVQFITLDGEGG